MLALLSPKNGQTSNVRGLIVNYCNTAAVVAVVVAAAVVVSSNVVTQC